MISPEFSRAVKDENLILTRIMLKNSLIVDTSFTQFDEMLFYAKCELANLTVPYDGKFLENDSLKWNIELMNIELVELINNFSETRINHLKKVIRAVLDNNQRKTVSPNSKPLNQQYYSRSNTQSFENTDKAIITQALHRIKASGKKITSIMDSVENNNRYTIDDIKDLENAANQMLSAIRLLKNNR